MPPKLGIIAGGGDLPAAVIGYCQTTGRPFFVVGLKDQADAETLEGTPHEWIRLGAAGKVIKTLRRERVDEIVLAGGVRRPSLAALRPDLWTAAFFAKTGAQKLGDDGLLKALIGVLEGDEGFTVVGADDLVPRMVAREGAYGTVEPSDTDRTDIATAFSAAKDLGRRDLGQAAIARDGQVLGLETKAGTDDLLARVASLEIDGRGGVLVKALKPGQERRVDLPAIGPDTVDRAAAAGLAGIALEAGNALVLDEAETIRRADAKGLFVVGMQLDTLGEGESWGRR